MKFNYSETRKIVNQQFKRSAFRRGVSAFRHGLIPAGVSDHLPIESQIPLSEDRSFSLLSWNLLADEHLYNNFMNITGSAELYAALNKVEGSGCAYTSGRNKLYYFFSELSQYLYAQVDHSQGGASLSVTDELLYSFVSADNQPSRLAKTPDQKKAIERDRLTILKLFLEDDHVLSGEFRLAIHHSVELISHIQSSGGALRWTNRFQLLKRSKALMAKLLAKDVLCLQECTRPEDMLSLFAESGRAMEMLVHHLPRSKTDHCVIMFDAEKYECLSVYRGDLQGRKPYLLATLLDKVSGKHFVVGSIHHPGGKVNLMPEIRQQLKALTQGDDSIPFYVAGDFNHTSEFCDARFPRLGTMAGNDYGHNNAAIDAVMSNQSDVPVKRVKEVPMSLPARALVKVSIFSKPALNSVQLIHAASIPAV